MYKMKRRRKSNPDMGALLATQRELAEMQKRVEGLFENPDLTIEQKQSVIDEVDARVEEIRNRRIKA